MRLTLAIGELHLRTVHPLGAGGFTLIELMVVLTILVLSATLIPLSLNRTLPSRRVAVAADLIGSAIRDAQADSIASGVPIRLAVQEHSLTAVALRSDRDPPSLQAMQLSTSVTLTLVQAGNQPQTELVVYPDGGTSGGKINIVDGIHHNAVVISALTGRVTRSPTN